MKKIMSMALSAVLVLGMALTGCGGGSSSGSGSGGDSGSGSSENSLRLVNNKVEIDAPLKELAAKYEEDTGTVVEIETLGGGVDVQQTLLGYYQAGNMPDIFLIEGDKDYKNWEGSLADLSGSAWVSDTDAAYTTADGTVYGFPYTTEAIGLAYNKAILDKAGVKPDSITGPKSMRAAFEKIDSQKDELGITSVIGYCAEATSLWWSSSNHLFGGAYLDEGLDRDDTTYIDLLNKGGKLDEKRFHNWAEMIGLFNEFADPDLAVTGTYDQQVMNFTSGQYAFVTQGSWIGATMLDDDHIDAYKAAGNFEVGMIPYAFEEGQDTIMTNTPNWWVVYQDGEVDAASAFLEWCAKNDGGQQILVEKCGFPSPYKSCTYKSPDPFAATILSYQDAGKTSAWHWLEMKDGLGQNAIGVVFQDFAAGTYDVNGFVDTFESVVSDYYMKN